MVEVFFFNQSVYNILTSIDNYLGKVYLIGKIKLQ